MPARDILNDYCSVLAPIPLHMLAGHAKGRYVQ